MTPIVFAASIAILIYATYRFWQVIAAREARWRIYAVRDEWRWLAINDQARIPEAAFVRFDQTLSRSACRISSLSLVALALTPSGDGDEEQDEYFQVLISQPETAVVVRNFGAAVAAYLRHRHWVLTNIVTAVRSLRHKRSFAEKVMRVLMRGDLLNGDSRLPPAMA